MFIFTLHLIDFYQYRRGFMGYGIFRCEKLKTEGNLAGSLKHARREIFTHNANPEKTPNNILLTDTPTVESVLAKYKALKPQKVRNDQVRAIEVMATASPDVMAKMTQEQQIQYLKECLAFANREFGEKNLLHAEIHLDETSPHLTAFYIPLVESTNARSKKTKVGLNAKVLLGDRAKYSQRQTDFYEQVSKKYGLERGEINSKAVHTKIRDYYRGVNKNAKLLDLDVKDLESKVKDRVSVVGVPVKTNSYIFVDDLKPVFDLAKSAQSFREAEYKRQEKKRLKRAEEDQEKKIELKYKELFEKQKEDYEREIDRLQSRNEALNNSVTVLKGKVNELEKTVNNADLALKEAVKYAISKADSKWYKLLGHMEVLYRRFFDRRISAGFSYVDGELFKPVEDIFSDIVRRLEFLAQQKDEEYRKLLQKMEIVKMDNDNLRDYLSDPVELERRLKEARVNQYISTQTQSHTSTFRPR